MASPASEPAAGSPATDCAGDPYAPYRFVGTVFAAVVAAAAVLEWIANARHPIARDFLSFWGAARLVLTGRPWEAYDNATLHAVQSAVANFGVAGAQMPFPYPPAYLALVAPFGLLSFPLAMAIWVIVTFALYLLAARKLIPLAGWLPLAFPAAYATAAIGQNGFLTAAIFMAGMTLMRRRPVVSGLVLGCLVVKPQLALLLPVAFVAGRSWRAIAGAAVSSTAILLAGLLSFGPATTAAWLSQLPLYARIGRDGLVGWPELASVYAFARQLGVGFGLAMALHAMVALVSAAAVWRIWRSPAQDGLKIAALAAGSMLASPYLFYYDGLILVPAYFWLAREGVSTRLLLAIWALPLIAIAQVAGLVPLINLNPVAPILLLALAYCRWELQRSPCNLMHARPPLRIEQPSAVTLSQPVAP